MHVPGDPSRTGLQLEEMTWTVRCDESVTVTSVPLSERPAAFGYLVRESDRFASFNKMTSRNLQCSELLALCSGRFPPSKRTIYDFEGMSQAVGQKGHMLWEACRCMHNGAEHCLLEGSLPFPACKCVGVGRAV